MATRTTRMRPLDNNKPLDIIRIVDDLDAKTNDEGGLGGRELEQTIEALEKKKDDVSARVCAPPSPRCRRQKGVESACHSTDLPVGLGYGIVRHCHDQECN